MTRPLKDVMKQLENYTLTWHHWLIILALLKLGGAGTKAQLLPVFKKEGFSPHAIETVFKNDLIELGEAIDFDDDIENLQDSTMIYLSDNPKFRSFLKKHLKSVIRILKLRSSR